MSVIKSAINLVNEWLKSESSTSKFIRLIETAGTAPHQIHLCYHNMPHTEKERMVPTLFLTKAIKTDDPAILQAVINLVGGRDVNQHVVAVVGNALGYAQGMSMDLLSYAFWERSPKAAMFLATHPLIELSADHLRSASYTTIPDLEKTILEKMGLGDFAPR